MSGHARQAPSARATIRQHADRARYGLAEACAVLDAGLVAHVALVRDGAPVVVPMAYGRIDDKLYLHGSVASRLLRALGEGAEVSVAVTVVDGLVLARSAFKHSMNYRSVVVHGRGREVTEPDERVAALRAITDHATGDRWASLRPMRPKELAATRVVAVPLVESAVKVRSGPPLDAEEDRTVEVWAGVLPLRVVVGEGRPDGEALGPLPSLRPEIVGTSRPERSS